MKLQNGDILLIRVNTFTRWYRWLLAKLIQIVDRNYYHHCAIYFDGKIHEADAEGVVINPLNKYERDEVVVYRPLKKLSYEEELVLEQLARIQLRKGYDYWGTMFFQLIYRLTGLWFGKTHKSASHKLYCSEHCVLPYHLLRGYFPKPWKISPGDLRRSTGYFYVEYEGELSSYLNQ